MVDVKMYLREAIPLQTTSNGFVFYGIHTYTLFWVYYTQKITYTFVI